MSMPFTLSPTTSSGQTSSQTGQMGLPDVDLLGGFSPVPPPVKQASPIPDPFAGKDPFDLSDPFNGPDPFAAPDPFTVLSTLKIPLDSLKPSMYITGYMYMYTFTCTCMCTCNCNTMVSIVGWLGSEDVSSFQS